MFESKLNSSFKNIYKTKKHAGFIIDLKKMEEYKARWKFPSVHLKATR